MYHTFRIQLALDIVVASDADSPDVAPLIRAVPNVTTVHPGMHVQWFVHQEDQFGRFVPDSPDGNLVWEVSFNGRSPFRDASYRCTLKTSATDFRHPLVHSADAAPVLIEQRGRFEYDIRVADENDRTISLEKAVLLVP